MDTAYNAGDFPQIPSEWNVRSLSTARKEIRRVGVGTDRKVIVDQAITLISEIYVHRRFKEATEAIDPCEALRLLSLAVGPWRSPPPDPDTQGVREWEFHAQLSTILNSLRDAHTVYLAPGAEKQRLAFIPLLIEQCDTNRYVVTKLGFEWHDLEVGAEITHWNGRPIADHLVATAELNPGANASARQARAIARLTCRWIGNGILPYEDWVVLTYGNDHWARCPWLVVDLPAPYSLTARASATRSVARMLPISLAPTPTTPLARMPTTAAARTRTTVPATPVPARAPTPQMPPGRMRPMSASTLRPSSSGG